MDLELFKKLFLFRTDIYAKQVDAGHYIKVDEPLTDEVIQQHLDGEQTIGLYQLKEDKLKWACLDIDLKKKVWGADDFDLSEWEDVLKEQAEEAKRLLKLDGIPSYIEHSGHKGYHVWMFFEEPVKAQPVKSGMERIFGRMKKMDENIAWEIFPKQGELRGDDVGSLVKGAAGFHNKSQEFSRFIDTIDPNDIQWAKEYKFYNLAPFERMRYDCGAINQAWEDAVEEGHASHHLRLAIGILFSNVAEEEQEIATEYIIDEFFSKLDDFDEATTREHLDHIRNKPQEGEETGYAPISCRTLQSENYGICPARCQEIKDGTTPHDFYKWEKGITKEGTSYHGSDPLDGGYDHRNGGEGSSELNKYFIKNNCYYFRKKNESIKISSFVIDLQYNYVAEDDQDSKTFYEGEFRSEQGEVVPFNVESDSFSDNKRLESLIYASLSPRNLLVPKSMFQLKQASQATSKTEKINVGKTFGFNDPAGSASKYPTKYITPSVIIDKDGVHKNEEIILDLSSEGSAGNLDLKIGTDEIFEDVKKNIKENFLQLLNPGASLSCFAHTFVPIVFPFISAFGDNTRYSFFLRGTSGTGKSYTTALMQNFYGSFEEGDITGWKSTPNALSRKGYYFKDAIFNIDDYKKDNLGTAWEISQKNGLLQSFSDQSARDRMKQDLTLNKSFPIRGWITTAAEHLPEGEASVLARIVPIEAVKEVTEYEKGRKCMRYKQYYPVFTARFIHHIFNTHPAIIDSTFEQYVTKFHKKVEKHSNGFRIARFTAILTTAFHLVAKFTWPKKEAQDKIDFFVDYQIKRMHQTIYEASEELASEKFVQIINELISTGKASLQESSSSNVVKSGFEHAEIIGYYGTVRDGDIEKEVPHLVASRAWELVQKNLQASGNKIGHTLRSVIQDLYQQGYLLDDREVVRKMNNNSARVIRFYPDKFNPKELEDIFD